MRRGSRTGSAPSNPGLWEFYRDEKIKLGQEDPGPYFGGDTGFLHLSKDPEADWERIAPHAMARDATECGAMMAAAGPPPGPRRFRASSESIEALKATGQYRVITPEQYVDELKAMGDAAFRHVPPHDGRHPRTSPGRASASWRRTSSPTSDARTLADTASAPARHPI
ncbi:hypothetical protein ACU686_09770 [Yinghuangia aomiensis]